MHDGEKREFRALMETTAAYYDRKLLQSTIAIYWNGLADLTLDAVRDALNAHAQDPQAGQFLPKIADIRRQIEAKRDDGHPGPDEAWAIALPARHESASVVWTPQIAAAFFGAAMPLLDEGDKIAARRAFIERYEREVAQARRDGIEAEWAPSFGSNPMLRAEAVESAALSGRISGEHAQKLLPAPEFTEHSLRLLESASSRRVAGDHRPRESLDALRRMLRLG